MRSYPENMIKILKKKEEGYTTEDIIDWYETLYGKRLSRNTISMVMYRLRTSPKYKNLVSKGLRGTWTGVKYKLNLENLEESEEEKTIKELKGGFMELNKVMKHNKGRLKLPEDINKERIKGAMKLCQTN